MDTDSPAGRVAILFTREPSQELGGLVRSADGGKSVRRDRDLKALSAPHEARLLIADAWSAK